MLPGLERVMLPGLEHVMLSGSEASKYAILDALLPEMLRCRSAWHVRAG